MACIDAGDSYETPSGKRRLLRLAGIFAIRAPNPSDVTPLIQRITKAGGLLDGHDAKKETAGWIVVTAPQQERERQIKDKGNHVEAVTQLRSQLREVVNPVFVDQDSGLRLLVSDGVVIRLKPDVDAETYFGAQWPAVRPLPGTTDQFVLTLAGSTAEQVLADVNARMTDAQVLWAEPDFLMEVVRHYTPNDTYYSSQWPLHNTGQGGGTTDADIDAPEAWDTTRGTSTVVVAIFDDGVQIAHPDLNANIFMNSNDPIDGVDNDNNGYADDNTGWDFYFGDNNPNPENVADTHGTPCAGVAAAVGNNGAGIAGIASGCRILPVKVFDGDTLASSTILANALRYAAGLTSPQSWRGADVISISLGFPQSSTFDSALSDAASNGRNGKGCSIFVATGNDASGYYYSTTFTGLPNAAWFLEWTYAKDGSASAGDDTCWIANVILPDGSRERFDTASTPTGWNMSPYGNPAWTIQNDPSHAFGTGRYQARAGAITHSQMTDMRSKTVSGSGDVSFCYWISSEAGYDGIEFWLHSDENGGTWYNDLFNDSGVIDYTTSPDYPASHVDTIAVGACTDFGYRSDYSQFGTALDVVMPSSGGARGVYTTDRTGADGNVSGDYFTEFGGTSAATPLAAGIGALVLSKNPRLTSAEVRTILRKSCDKIGAVTYSGGDAGAGGWNIYYGYGRLNANLALNNTVSTPEIQAPEMGLGGAVVLRWTSSANHFYTVYHSTNLLNGFSVLRSNIQATSSMNTYTDNVNGVSTKFWMVSTEE